ncbi:aldehyde dehydrogenase family protein [Thalassotalea sp. PLHSN55]|uniref:aldehyde dehydrogenase family protein n=1 Tax=Thalassotalea sp. PLHSN55 TaxID=3435888 RepID=UPI003F857D96
MTIQQENNQVKKNYINGKWVPSERYSTNINPSNLNEVIGYFSEANKQDALDAIMAAKDATAIWAGTGIQQRSDILDNIGNKILSRQVELGELLAREEGKTRAEAMGEVHRAGSIFKFFAGEVLRQSGEAIDSVRPGVSVTTTRSPVGVVGIITPWNFPIAIPAWKIAPALAYGNTVVFKPAELVPASAHALAEIIVEAGVPAGVFNLVMGEGKVVGDILVKHKDVKAITFTGSVNTGRAIAVEAVKNMKKIQLEMGGKNPAIVLDDADIDLAVETCVQSAFYSTGQRCTASSRIIVTAGIHDKFVKAMQERMSKITVGDALSESTDIGPVVDEKQLVQNLAYVEIGKAEGAELVCGGEKLTLAKTGFYMSPALFINTTNDMRINQEEIFGPIATIIKVKDYQQALAVANDSEFGLSAGICTTSLKYAKHFQENIQAGMTMVNLPTAGVDYHVPFGGTKGSSYGSREQGSYAKEFYTTVKTSYLSA